MADDDLKEQNNNKKMLLQGSESTDRLSSLHDSIIVDCILSLLPFRQVVRTEVLSKRWKSLWICASSFDITDSVGYNRYGFTTSCWDSVQRVVLFRNTSIKQFRISMRSFVVSSYPRAQSIISSLVSLNIPHLDVSLFVEDEFTLLDSIFDFRSYTVLKLSISKKKLVKSTLKLPVCVSLPCLKVLHLCDFEFPNAESVEKLLSCCPVLEELALLRCNWLDQSNIAISSPSVKRLTMELNHSSSRIKIEAPALECFKCTCSLTNHFCFDRTSSSFESFIHITNPCFMWTLEEVKYFQGLEENIVSLTISNGTAPYFLSLVGNDHIDVPVFHRLTYLNLMMNLKGSDLKGLRRFFDFLPNLETLEFSQTIRTTGFSGMLLPNSLSSSLRVLILQKFNGHSDEYSFLSDFMEKAVSLKRINIFPSEDIDMVNRQQMREVLEKLSTRFKPRVVINVV